MLLTGRQCQHRVGLSWVEPWDALLVSHYCLCVMWSNWQTHWISSYLNLYNEMPQNSETWITIVIHYLSGLFRSRVLEYLQQHVCPWTSDEVAVRQRLVLGCSEGFFVHTTSWEDSNHEGHPRLVLYGISLWSLQHSHFRVVTFLHVTLGLPRHMSQERE